MSKKLILAHYMPWFTDGAEGDERRRWVHWKSGGEPPAFGLSDTNEYGRPKIGSHYYPLCGRYSSRDADVIKRHLWLMEQHGIDGIIVNWYGLGEEEGATLPYDDYIYLHAAVMTIWACVKEHNKGRDTKFKFALCFDGGSLKVVQKLKEDGETTEGPHEYAMRSLKEAKTQFFDDTTGAYLKHDDDGRPILLVFQLHGEPWIRDAKLGSVCEALSSPPPLLLSEDEKADWADGAFVWPKVEPSGNVDVVRPWTSVRDNLTRFYADTQQASSAGIVMGVAFPGFRDIFRADNRKDQHKEIVEREGGDTYRRTLRLALSQCHVQYVQIATWNDWEEGTQIEPSVEFGDRELRATRELLNQFGSD